MFANSCSVLDKDGDVGNNNGRESQLNVAYPERRLTSFENFLYEEEKSAW